MSAETVIVFGATGVIGASITEWFKEKKYSCIGVSRSAATNIVSKKSDAKFLIYDPKNTSESFSSLNEESVNAVVWAQGANLNDTIFSFDIERHLELYEANVTYILLSLNMLLNRNLLAPSARLCVISSIWQHLSKQDKLSYTITKSAIQGLVNSLSIDLGCQGYMINAVLPGALDNPMTRKNLTTVQIESLQAASPLGTLPSLSDVTNIVGFLCSRNNTGITGQFIAADRGFSNARII